MKNAIEFYHVLGNLPEEERKEIADCVNHICDLHKSEDWAIVYHTIVSAVTYALNCRLTDEEFAEQIERNPEIKEEW